MPSDAVAKFEPTVEEIQDYRLRYGVGLNEARRALFRENLVSECQRARTFGGVDGLAAVLEAVIVRLT
jgi:hypothetical protein